MSNDGWRRSFDDPIQVGEKTVVTLRDAADYIVALPPKTSGRSGRCRSGHRVRDVRKSRKLW